MTVITFHFFWFGRDLFHSALGTTYPDVLSEHPYIKGIKVRDNGNDFTKVYA